MLLSNISSDSSGSILHHLHGYISPETTIGRLQARLGRFMWGSSRMSSREHPGALCRRRWRRPVDIAGQLRFASLKGVQASLHGATNGYSWLVRSQAWLTSPASDIWFSLRRRRLLILCEVRL
ncbi:hypothetical protein LAZ67_2006084 [Cordylochernes scorpioides]|uniref:Uncharacterized protein n=1 Tax=Cordylochernes scorpioides TaxID=51811 RepID=A0ABY6K5S1_9ARAC|nr:hypothetical protein LAZ67_2006084 [Cordylochernes scorpioides]